VESSLLQRATAAAHGGVGCGGLGGGKGSGGRGATYTDNPLRRRYCTVQSGEAAGADARRNDLPSGGNGARRPRGRGVLYMAERGAVWVGGESQQQVLHSWYGAGVNAWKAEVNGMGRKPASTQARAEAEKMWERLARRSGRMCADAHAVD